MAPIPYLLEEGGRKERGKKKPYKLQSHSVWQPLRRSYWVRGGHSIALQGTSIELLTHCRTLSNIIERVRPYLLGTCAGCTVGHRRRFCRI